MRRRATPAQKRQAAGVPPPTNVRKFQTIEERETEHYLGELFDPGKLMFRVNLRPWVLFRSFSRATMTHPLGPPRRQPISSPGGALESLVINKPEVLFENHMYGTDDANIAAGLILSESFGHRSQGGWWLEADACMPQVLASIYEKVSLETQRKIALDMLRGKSVEQIRGALTEEDLAPVTDARASDGRPMTYREICQHSGCGQACEFTGENAVEEVRKLMAMHNLIRHNNRPITKPTAATA